MSICLIFVLYDLQNLSSWIIYKVHVHEGWNDICWTIHMFE
jgi:hypothetical protein